MKAVFFDLDGVLIDSETVQHRILKENIERFQLDVPAEAFIPLIGSHKSLNPWDQIIAKHQLKQSKEELREILFGARYDQFQKINKKGMLFPEVPEVLKQLRQKGVLLACASSSHRSYIMQALNECEIASCFDLITTSDDFKRSKPAPDIYKHCLKQLQVKPEESVVVEDSPIGIQAAKAAKIKVFARRNPEIALDQSQADAWIDSLEVLLQLI